MFTFPQKDPIAGAMVLMQGNDLLSQGDFRRAIKFYNKAIQLLPSDAEILENAFWSRGLAKRNLGDLTQAINDFNHAISLNDEYLLAYSSRADCYARFQEWHKAIVDFEKALTLQYDVWHQVATDNLEDAGLLHQKQVKYEMHVGAAMAYSQVVDFKNCLRHLEAAFEINPDPQISNYIQQARQKIS